MGCSLETVLSRGVVTLSSIEKLSVSSFRSVDVGRPNIAGPGISVTKKGARVFSPLYEQGMVTIP